LMEWCGLQAIDEGDHPVALVWVWQCNKLFCVPQVGFASI
jgi:hypothetical protein